MRRDFDFVTMEDYVSDTRELAEQGAAVISNLREQIAHRERLIWAIVQAVGGRVSVPNRLFIRAPEGLTRMEQCASDDALLIVATTK